jgi:hypothetical protein
MIEGFWGCLCDEQHYSLQESSPISSYFTITWALTWPFHFMSFFHCGLVKQAVGLQQQHHHHHQIFTNQSRYAIGFEFQSRYLFELRDCLVENWDRKKGKQSNECLETPVNPRFSPCFQKKIFFLNLIFFYILDRFDALISKIIFKK